jgi:hypothetical protein
MIEFLRPWFLAVLPLAMIPLALHFWGRFRSSPTPFTALELLREAARDRFSTERLRRWFLLLVRTLLLVAVMLFLARPGFRGVGGGDSVRGVILLDASYSLQVSHAGQTAFDRGRTIAQTLLQNKKKDDRWGLVVFSDRIESSYAPDEKIQTLLQGLGEARPTFRGTRFLSGFQEAAKFLPQGGAVVLISDMAAHGWEGKLFEDATFSGVVAVEVVPPQTNGAVTGLLTGGPGEERRVSLHSWGDATPRTWTLRPEGRPEARGVVRWENGAGTVHLPLGKERAEFALNPDALSVDDRWFSVSNLPHVTTVYLVNGAPSLSPVGDETYFIRPVLDRLSLAGTNVVVVSPTDLTPSPLAHADVVVLLNPPPLPLSAVEALSGFVESGGGLWITGGDRGGAVSLQPLLPLSDLKLQEVDEGLEWVGGDLFPSGNGLLWSRVHVDRAVVGRPRPGATIVLKTRRSKRPLLTLSAQGRGRVALWGTTVDRDWSNFPTKPAFPILIGDLLNWVSGSVPDETLQSVFVGEPLERSGNGQSPLHVLRPDGREEPLEWISDRWVYRQTDRPGFYEIRGEPGKSVGVNVRAEREGNLTRMSLADVQSSMGDTPVRWVSPEMDPAEELRDILHGRDLTPWVAHGILAFIVLETLALFYRRRKNIKEGIR